MKLTTAILCVVPLSTVLTAAVVAQDAVPYTTSAYRVSASSVVDDGKDAPGMLSGMFVALGADRADRQAFLAFRMPVTSAPITEATLRLRGVDAGGTPAGTPAVDIYEVSPEWDGGVITWNTRPEILPNQLGRWASMGDTFKTYDLSVLPYVLARGGTEPPAVTPAGTLISFGLVRASDETFMAFHNDTAQVFSDRQALRLATSATPEQFIQQHCVTCHSTEGDTISGGWEEGTQPFCYFSFMGPTKLETREKIRSYVETMVEAETSTPTAGHAATTGSGEVKGGTTGCYGAQGDCVEIIDAVATHISKNICGNPD